MVEVPISLHIFWKEKGLVQGLSYMASVPPTVMPEGSIPGNGHIVYLQLKRPSAGWDSAPEPQEAPLGYQQS